MCVCMCMYVWCELCVSELCVCVHVVCVCGVGEVCCVDVVCECVCMCE